MLAGQAEHSKQPKVISSCMSLFLKVGKQQVILTSNYASPLFFSEKKRKPSLRRAGKIYPEPPGRLPQQR